MGFIRDTFRWFLIWLHFVPKPHFTIREVTDHPVSNDMVEGRIYLVGGKGYKKWAYFLCPTGSGELIKLSLQQNHSPRWEVKSDILGRPTIYPSVRQLDGSYAHFWIKEGAVEWCADTGRKPRLDRHY